MSEHDPAEHDPTGPDAGRGGGDEPEPWVFSVDDEDDVDAAAADAGGGADPTPDGLGSGDTGGDEPWSDAGADESQSELEAAAAELEADLFERHFADDAPRPDTEEQEPAVASWEATTGSDVAGDDAAAAATDAEPQDEDEPLWGSSAGGDTGGLPDGAAGSEHEEQLWGGSVTGGDADAPGDADEPATFEVWPPEQPAEEAGAPTTGSHQEQPAPPAAADAGGAPGPSDDEPTVAASGSGDDTGPEASPEEPAARSTPEEPPEEFDFDALETAVAEFGVPGGDEDGWDEPPPAWQGDAADATEEVLPADELPPSYVEEERPPAPTPSPETAQPPPASVPPAAAAGAEQDGWDTPAETETAEIDRGMVHGLPPDDAEDRVDLMNFTARGGNRGATKGGKTSWNPFRR